MSGRLVAFDHPMLRRQTSGPWNLWSNPWNFDVALPSRLLDQHFGLGLLEEDLFPPQVWRGVVVRPRRQPAQQASGMSEVSFRILYASLLMNPATRLPDSHVRLGYINR